ncbi:DUF2269 family protein [Rhodospira trueperi]|uniref:Predicted integral membrane protein n=1 Tax=Rhodospira trueperi TaxID=69960 RepID=A0A1G7FNN3_9PROT|nr:DUF2269 family protein [Rhodospira trueperi]SDE77547.1 Predicted integral membrane protein [Rhodospira trueperi]
MDLFTLLKFGHLVGVILFGAGLLATFVVERQALMALDATRLTEALRYALRFNTVLTLPGAGVIAVTGTSLIIVAGYWVPDHPWIAVMAGLFLVQAGEITALGRVRTRRAWSRARAALAPDITLAKDGRTQVLSPGFRATHVLNLPVFGLIVFCGAVRPESWLVLLAAGSMALGVAAALTRSVDPSRQTSPA